MDYTQPIRIGGFRSLMEFEWALTFDTLGFDYWYEPRGFELYDDITYLPDFYFQDKTGNWNWGEVKARNFHYDEIRKCKLLSCCYEANRENDHLVVLLKEFPSTGKKYDAFRCGFDLQVGFNGDEFVSTSKWQPHAGITKDVNPKVLQVQRLFNKEKNPNYSIMMGMLRNNMDPSLTFKNQFPFAKTLHHLEKQGWDDYRINPDYLDWQKREWIQPC